MTTSAAKANRRADIVDRQEAEIERLRAALKPFADAADLLERNNYVDGSDIILRQNGMILGHAPVQTRDLIAAKRVYEQLNPAPAAAHQQTERKTGEE